jgi:hypothetical protein
MGLTLGLTVGVVGAPGVVEGPKGFMPLGGLTVPDLSLGGAKGSIFFFLGLAIFS